MEFDQLMEHVNVFQRSATHTYIMPIADQEFQVTT